MVLCFNIKSQFYMWFIDQDLSSAFTKLTLTKSFIISACSFNGFDMRYKSKQDFICQYLTFHSSSVVGYRSVMSGCTLHGNIMLNANNKMQLAIYAWIAWVTK